VFVTGQSAGRKTGPDYATVAYDAATGRQLWVRRHNGFGSNPDIAYSVAVSPAGTSVFVTGQSWSGRTTGAYATIAYSATTGRQLWSRRYNVRGGWAYSVAVNQAGTIMFVSGENEADAEDGSSRCGAKHGEDCHREESASHNERSDQFQSVNHPDRRSDPDDRNLGSTEESHRFGGRAIP